MTQTRWPASAASRAQAIPAKLAPTTRRSNRMAGSLTPPRARGSKRRRSEREIAPRRRTRASAASIDADEAPAQLLTVEHLEVPPFVLDAAKAARGQRPAQQL